jgi:hypothetical protein
VNGTRKDTTNVQDTRYSFGPLWAGIRAELRAIRAGYSARRALRRDLAFAAPREILELEAMLEYYPDEQTTDVRRVLSERRADIAMSAALIPGGISRAA